MGQAKNKPPYSADLTDNKANRPASIHNFTCQCFQCGGYTEVCMWFAQAPT